MSVCSFKKLVQLLDKKMDLDGKLEVLNHLDVCDICREAIYQISRDRDESFLVYKPYREQGKVA